MNSREKYAGLHKPFRRRAILIYRRKKGSASLKHTFVVTAAALCLTALITTIVYHLAEKSAAEPAETGTIPVTAEAETETMALGLYDGKLALFRNGSAYPAEIYEIYAGSLPKADQEALAAGIPVADEAELAELLEDYDS